MNKLIVLFVTMIHVTSCQAQNNEEKVNARTVADIFLIEDIYINSYFVADKDLDDIYEHNRDWVKAYFPTILKEYDLTLYSQFSIACMLYLEGDQEYLLELWDEHERLKVDDEFKPVLHLLKHYDIELE